MRCSLAAGLVALAAGASAKTPCPKPPTANPIERIVVGVRPGFLVDDMDAGSLKDKLQECLESPDPLKASLLSVAHRGGGTLQMPEHSLQSNMAGARMGAGILECDVAFTKDRELVCRHSQCDLHYTTNIVAIPELNAKCTKPFTPADGDTPADALCCTSDITLAEFRQLCATMEGFDPEATTPEQFIDTPPSWRTDLYSTCGTVLSLQDHIALTVSLGLKHTPELKTPEVEMPFEGDYTQEDYAQQLIDEYKEAGVPPEDVFLQSFLYDDILYWLQADPDFGAQALFLDSYGETPETFPDAVANLTTYAADGVKYLSPPIPYLLTAKDGKVVPSEYADKAVELGFKIIAWSLERSGRLADVKADEDYYYMYFADAINNDGDMYDVVDVMVRDIGIVGLFSDWSATVTFYANCFGIGLLD
jgi:glycerophosphoryl diester phosphodiesterase